MGLFPVFRSPNESSGTPIFDAMVRGQFENIDVGDPFEAFAHACDSWQRFSDPVDREAIHIYVDLILDSYLEDSSDAL